jgi:hypothetical protein
MRLVLQLLYQVQRRAYAWSSGKRNGRRLGRCRRRPCSPSSNRFNTSHEVGRTDMCHEVGCKVDKIVECIGCADVESASEPHQVAKLYGLDGRGARCLTRELVPASRIPGISDYEHGLFMASCGGLCGATPLLIRIRGV